MATDLNKVFLIGRLTREPEMRHTQSGMAVASFSIANNKTYTTNGEKKEQVSFFNCTAWSKIGEAIAQYTKKGDRVAVEGRLQQRSWEDKDGTKRTSVEIVVEAVQFLQGKPIGENENKQTHDDKLKQSFDSIPEGNPFNDDDIPF